MGFELYSESSVVCMIIAGFCVENKAADSWERDEGNEASGGRMRWESGRWVSTVSSGHRPDITLALTGLVAREMENKGKTVMLFQ